MSEVVVVIEGERGRREYPTTMDAIETYGRIEDGAVYDFVSGCCESTDDSDSVSIEEQS